MQEVKTLIQTPRKWDSVRVIAERLIFIDLGRSRTFTSRCLVCIFVVAGSLELFLSVADIISTIKLGLTSHTSRSRYHTAFHLFPRFLGLSPKSRASLFYITHIFALGRLGSRLNPFFFPKHYLKYPGDPRIYEQISLGFTSHIACYFTWTTCYPGCWRHFCPRFDMFHAAPTNGVCMLGVINRLMAVSSESYMLVTKFFYLERILTRYL
ncbi:hypothetical protein DL96DRAFT_267084 [Flagelloscypha sp. PMI_526]|nr:hypothetical protein DL96DRAFT_267084 [Flagelloscypha sp. PMI_526]